MYQGNDFQKQGFIDLPEPFVLKFQLQPACIGKKGGMWIVGEWLSAMATCMRVILILLLYVFVVEQYLISLRNNTPH